MIFCPRRPQGFTLIELIIVIIITGALAAVVAPIVSGTFSAYTDSSRRATLVQQAQSIVQRIQQDLSYAVPSSVEILENSNEEPIGVRWLALTRSPNPDHPPTGRYTASFDVSSEQIAISVLGCVGEPQTGTQQSVVIGNPDDPAVVESIDQSTCATSSIVLDSPTTFDPNGIGSPYNRLYLTSGQMNIDCTDNGTIRRYSGTNHDDPADAQQLASNVHECDLTLDPGTTLTAPTLLIDITLEDESGERVRLVRQLQLSNAL